MSFRFGDIVSLSKKYVRTYMIISPNQTINSAMGGLMLNKSINALLTIHEF